MRGSNRDVKGPCTLASSMNEWRLRSGLELMVNGCHSFPIASTLIYTYCPGRKSDPSVVDRRSSNWKTLLLIAVADTTVAFPRPKAETAR